MAEFESEVASLLGKEAALFCPSGVMAQLIALKIHARATTKPSSHTGSVGHRGRGSFLVHGSSHLLLHEHDAHKELIELDAVKVGVFEVKSMSKSTCVVSPMTTASPPFAVVIRAWIFVAAQVFLVQASATYTAQE